MKDFTFRIRFKLAGSCSINTDVSYARITVPNVEQALLISSQATDEPINQARDLILKAGGWSSAQEAQKAGERYRDALMVTFAGLRIGADFGDRSPKSFVTNGGLARLGQQFEGRLLNDEHGLMAFESEPTPRFASAGSGSIVIGTQWNRFEDLFKQAVHHNSSLSEQHRLAIELFNSSFFENSSDTRFLTLVMAVEALLEPSNRSEVATAHVEDLIELTKNSTSLSQQEKDSLLGSLKWLRKESISKTGGSLASDWLKDKVYMSKKAPAFFRQCYDIRSRLVHGNNKRPSRDEVSSTAANLEVFVSDLLCAMLTPTNNTIK